MSEAERIRAKQAIRVLEQQRLNFLEDFVDYGGVNDAYLLAISTIESALRAQEQNEPQCRDCKHLGKAWACDNCTYDRELRDRTSYYEPKGAHQ